MFVLLYEFFWPITVLSWIFHFGVLLYIINRDEIPEFKMPWLMILFLLPVIGAFVFMLFSSNSTSQKEYRRSEKAMKDMEPYVRRPERMTALKEQNTDAWLQANYLYESAGMPCQGNTKTTYYPIGEDFHAVLLEELKKAEHFIFMEYFIVQGGVIPQRASRQPWIPSPTPSRPSGRSAAKQIPWLWG